MDFLSLLDKYPATINGVVGAAIGVIGSLAGVAITSWFNLKAKDKEAKNSRILRLRTYGDQLLEEKFRVFTRKRLEVGTEIFDEIRRDQKAAYDKLQEAISLASDILVSIKGKLVKIET